MGRPKHYTINEGYFNAPMNERQAYLLGLLFSDGHLNYKRGQLEYVCKSDDEELVYFIKKEFQSTHPIKPYVVNNRIYKKYSISSAKLIRDVIDKFNLPLSNKSKNNLHLPKLDIQFMPHFLRGIFDGDGSIWDGGGTPAASFTGSECLLTEIKEILKPLDVHFVLRYRYGRKNKNSCMLETHGSLQVDRLGKYLYAESSVFLKRKKQKFDQCSDMAAKFKNKQFNYNGNEERIKQLYVGGMRQFEIAKNLNLVFSSVRACVQRLRKRNEVV